MLEKFVENYENLSDEEIVALIKGGDNALLNVLIVRYYPTIFYYVSQYFSANYSEDAFQEATLALYSAINGYDSEKASFKTFAILCIKRALYDYIKRNNRQKDIPQDMLSSLDEVVVVDYKSPEKIFFEREAYESLAATIRLELSPLEYSVLELFLAGEKYGDIAEKLSVSEKSVDNALGRIRKKIKGNDSR